jgi:hypothetical protein
MDQATRSSPWWNSGRCGPWAWARAASAGYDLRWGPEGSPVGARDEDGDEAKPRGCSPEHKGQQRGDAMEEKSGGGLSSL